MRLANPNVFHPILQFRYTVITPELPGATIFARAATQPTCDNNPIRAFYGNSYINYKGRTSWEPITLRCYQYEGVTMPQFWTYVQRHQIVKFATDWNAERYKHTIIIAMLGPDGVIPVGSWKLRGAFLQNVKFGDMDWGGEDVVQLDVTIVYDYAEYSLII